MRGLTLFAAVLFVSAPLSFSVIRAQASEWIQISDPNEVRQLISDKTLDGKYWKFYFRSDGKLAYEQGGYTSFREWKISADGEICMYIYGMPDKLLECQALLQTDVEPIQYKVLHPRGESALEIVEPEQSHVDALLQKAGPVN